MSDPQFTLRDTSQTPILLSSTYKDAVYASFDEFLANSPSITRDYEVKIGKKIKLSWIMADGSRRAIRKDVYAFAKDNKLYVLFNRDFYAMDKINNTFEFTSLLLCIME